MDARVRSGCRCGGTSKGRKQLSPLSQREAEVLELVRTGHSTKDIAAQLGISTSTVLWHRKLALARQTAAALQPSRIPRSSSQRADAVAWRLPRLRRWRARPAARRRDDPGGAGRARSRPSEPYRAAPR